MRIDPLPAGEGVEEIERALDTLGARLVAGDVRPKPYARLRQDLLARLGRRKIAAVLERGEAVAAEHHWVEGYARIPASPLRETAQACCSVYATDRRLFRWRFQDRGRPDAALLDDFEETLEYQWYRDVRAVRRSARPRWAEAATGAVIAAVGWAAGDHLAITGRLFLALGLFGLAHGTLVPTRTIVLDLRPPGQDPWVIWSARKPSGRAVLARLAAGMNSPTDLAPVLGPAGAP